MYVDPVRTSSQTPRGPAMYFGYCMRSGTYRMMDLADYLASLQEGAQRWNTGVMAMYRDLGGETWPSRHEDVGVRIRKSRCSSDYDCHCVCCVCDADVLIYARCGETRRIPITFENDTRRERQVQLELAKFVTAGGHDLGWPTDLSPATFTLRPCGEQTVVVRVEVRCDPFRPAQPSGDATAGRPPDAQGEGRVPTLDRCEVAYATLRAEGCLVRPILIAIAVLPDDCDAYQRSCSCGCC